MAVARGDKVANCRRDYVCAGELGGTGLGSWPGAVLGSSGLVPGTFDVQISTS